MKRGERWSSPARAKPQPPAAQLLNQPAAPRPGSQMDQVTKGAEGEGGAGAFPGRGITQTIRGLMRDTFAESSGGLEPVLQAQTGKIGKVGRVAGHKNQVVGRGNSGNLAVRV